MLLIRIFAIVLVFSAISINAHAALYDRGNGMIYDSALNITWLQDANYAKTSGYSTSFDGQMTHEQAAAWAAQLTYGGYSDWRLSSARLLDPQNNNPCNTYDGNCDNGYNNTRSEMGHLTYVDLGNIGTYSPSGQMYPGYIPVNNAFVDAGTGATINFLNLSGYRSYWQQELTVWSLGGSAWAFHTGSGQQDSRWSGYEFYAWAVRDGDVAAIPAPAAAWLFGSGLLGLAGIARKNKHLSKRN